MAGGPTKGASEPTRTWRASPWLSWSLRGLAFLVPLLAAYLAIRAVGPSLVRPSGPVGAAVWIVQAAAVGALVSHGVGRLTRRLLPLAALLQLTLVFPDQAPSRFGVALRSGTVKQMRARAEAYHRDGLGSTPGEAAENAIVLVNGLGRHDRLTRGHTERVRAYADLIAEEMGLSDDDRNGLAWGVLLHDVGKIEVPSSVLNKKEKLTDDEWQQLQQHPAIGAEMLRPLAQFLGEWIGAAGEHHERWDGKGYPNGLAGTDISLAGRITAVADAYDVITSKRSYKEPMSNAAAREELVRCSGGQFDPTVVRALLNASVGTSRSAGWLAWLTEIPVVRAGVSMATSPAVGAVAFTTAAVLGLADDSDARRTAFAAELEQLEATVTTTTPAPADATTSPDRSRPTQADLLGDDVIDDAIEHEVADAGGSSTTPPTTDGPADGIVVDTGTIPGQWVDTVVTQTTSPTITTTPSATVPSSSATSTTQPPAAGGAAPSTTLAPIAPTAPTTPTTVVTSPPTTLLPSLEVPSIGTPQVTTPPLTVPSLSTPILTTPELTVPSLTVPAVTTPPITTPAVTVPPDLTIDLSLGGLLG